MAVSQSNSSEQPGPPAAPSLMVRGLAALGAPVVASLTWVGGLNILMWQTGQWIWRSVVLRRVRLGRQGLYSQMVRVGVRSVGVIALVCGCIGFILALQMAAPLETYGATDSVATIVAIAVVRELGPLISAVVMCGFAGASIAAELGTMVVGEEIEALEAHALNPVRFLVMPRIIATTISMLVLCIIGILIAIFSSYLVGVHVLGISPGIYYLNVIDALDLADVFTGMWKAGVFGMIIGSIACYNGLKVSGAAAGVGKATTHTVVASIVCIIVADLLFTSVFYRFGWT